MSRLEDSITTLVELFTEYADGRNSITMDDFKDMLDNEIACKDVKENITEDVLDRLLAEMDSNKSGKINICEYARGVAMVINILYKMEKE